MTKGMITYAFNSAKKTWIKKVNSFINSGHFLSIPIQFQFLFFQFQFLVQFLELSQELSSIPIQFRNWPQLWYPHDTNYAQWTTSLNSWSTAEAACADSEWSQSPANMKNWPNVGLILPVCWVIFLGIIIYICVWKNSFYITIFSGRAIKCMTRYLRLLYCFQWVVQVSLYIHFIALATKWILTCKFVEKCSILSYLSMLNKIIQIPCILKKQHVCCVKKYTLVNTIM